MIFKCFNVLICSLKFDLDIEKIKLLYSRLRTVKDHEKFILNLYTHFLQNQKKNYAFEISVKSGETAILWHKHFLTFRNSRWNFGS
jgi:predicted acyl esterase